MKKILVASVIALAVVLGSSSANAAGYSFTKYLSVGSTGADVSALQSWLVDNGFLKMPAGVAMGYFGQLTKASVAAYQASAGLPSTGFVGPLTIAKLNAAPGSMVGGTSCPPGFTASTVAGFGAVCVPSTGGGSTGGTTGGSTSLEGTDGTIDDVDVLSQYSNEEVGDGESDVKVLGFDLEASTDGDILVKSLKVSFDSTGNSGSDNLDDYIDAVSIWMGSTKVGSADVSDFNESSSVWSKTITLNKSAVVNADETAKFYVSVDAVSNLDSSDISGDSWTIDVDSIRIEDGSGVTTTDSSTGDINAMNVAINFVSFSSAADTELKVSTDSSSPEETVVTADDTEDTDDVLLLVGKLKLEGTSDVVIDEIPVTLTVTGAADVDIVTGSLKLIIEGEEYSESVSTATVTSASVTFDNLDLTLEAGKTITFKVLADINDIESGTFDEGDTLTASITSTNRDYMDVENEEGDQLSDSTEKSGTATGDAQEFRTSGIQLTLVSTNTAVTTGQSASDDLGTFTIKFKVTATGDTVYVSSLSDAQLTGVTTGYTTVLVDRSGTATVGGVSATLTNITDDDLNSTGLYEIEEGESETFELTTTVQLPTAGAAGQFRAVLGGVSWSTSSTDALPDNEHTSDLDSFKTSYVGLN